MSNKVKGNDIISQSEEKRGDYESCGGTTECNECIFSKYGSCIPISELKKNKIAEQLKAVVPGSELGKYWSLDEVGK